MYTPVTHVECPACETAYPAAKCGLDVQEMADLRQLATVECMACKAVFHVSASADPVTVVTPSKWRLFGAKDIETVIFVPTPRTYLRP